MVPTLSEAARRMVDQESTPTTPYLVDWRLNVRVAPGLVLGRLEANTDRAQAFASPEVVAMLHQSPCTNGRISVSIPNSIITLSTTELALERQLTVPARSSLVFFLCSSFLTTPTSLQPTSYGLHVTAMAST